MVFNLCRKQGALLLIISLFYGSAFAQKSAIKKGLNVFTAEKLKTHIDYLASDALLGRNTPSSGLDTAAAYIVKEFKTYGVQPVNGSYYQPVPLIMRSLGDENSVEIIQNGLSRQLKLKSEFVPYEVSGDGEASGNLVFAGYGISAPEYNYDDYSDVDVKGKIVVVLRHEPGEEDSASVFMGKESTTYSSNKYKVENAIKHGAVGMLVITDPLNHLLLTPRGFSWPSLSKLIPKDALPYELDDTAKRIPVVHAGKEVIDMLFGSTDSLKKIQVALDKSFKPLSREYPVSVKMKVSINKITVKTNNIVGVIEGADPVLKNEYLVVGAHYDHVGFHKEHKPDEDYIINGADDNASGTAGLLSIAEAFSKMGTKPKRSILFIAFTAEEKGLFGSAAYTNKPLFPLNKTMAMINLDMISRNGIDTVYLEGTNVSPDLARIAESQNKEVGFTILHSNEYIDRSDHINFYRKGVPFVYFNSGEHNDYHTVRDNPDSVNPEKAAKIAGLAFRTAWYIANDNKEYAIKEE